MICDVNGPMETKLHACGRFRLWYDLRKPGSRNGVSKITARRLDRASSTPLYQQIMNILLEEYISRGEGMQIPTEIELANRFQVSRMTVRQAVQELIRQGVLVRYRGRGTFVAPSRIRHSIHSHEVLSLFEDLNLSGKILHSIILLRELVDAPTYLKSLRVVDENEKVVELVRLRTLNDRPLVYQVSYFPAEFYPVISTADLAKVSLLRVLEQHFHTRPVKAQFSVRATAADATVCQKLSIRPGDPLLRVEKLSFGEQEKWFEHAVLYCPPDEFEITFSSEYNARVRT